MPSIQRSLLTGTAAVTALVAGLAISTPAQAYPLVRAVAPTVAPAVAPAAVPAALPSSVERISGATRFDTAIATSQDEFPTTGSAKAVVLTRADTYPDALAGVPLAAKVGGPLLLTSSAALNPTVSAEITRVLPAGGTVYILGGTAAVSAAVATTLTTNHFVVKRLAGSDRFATAVAVADALGDPSTVFEATGLNFPDALAGGPAAIVSNAAILLTNGSVQSPATAAYLAAHTGGTHYALGGPAAAADPTATSIVGTDRYETATEVADKFFAGPTVVGVATGTNFPDALAAGPDLASKIAPLLLVPPSGPLPEGPTGELLSYTPALQGALVFGGTSSISDAVASQVGALASLGSTVLTETASATFTGQYGVLGTHLQTASGSANTTQVFDGLAGTSTFYTQGAATKTIPNTPTRADFAAFPTTDFSALESAINAKFATVYAAEGYSSTDADAQFLVNAEQVLLNPLATPTLRLAVFVAVSELPNIDIQSGVQDADGRTGIVVFGTISGNASLNGDQLGYIMDPATGTLLEDDIVNGAGNAVAASTVTTFTTTTTAPADPYPA
ncbi:MAG TPA: cell wall-binding repeat-containing protein [Acidothermaceae bacterium]|jgi:putative cell wall-binding protein|nr:cell wall-binding repeat-containing protein [Acidothermaceae bacterium]